MKNYTFVLIPEKVAKEKIENLRVKYTNSKLVDGLPPHISLKRRFTLIENYSEDELRQILEKFMMPKILVRFKYAQKLGEVYALVGKSLELLNYHRKLLAELGEKVITKNPELEGKNFKIHLTLFRNFSADIALDDFIRREISFDKICLYELDPSPMRSFANEIKCKTL